MRSSSRVSSYLPVSVSSDVSCLAVYTLENIFQLAMHKIDFQLSKIYVRKALDLSAKVMREGEKCMLPATDRIRTEC